MTTLKVNFTGEEAESKVYVVPPSGSYLCNIVEATDEVVRPNKKNTGKPYWRLRMVIQDGPHSGTSLFGAVMLFDGALYSLAQLMKAFGQDIGSGEFVVPETDTLVGRQVVARGVKRPAKTDPDGNDLPERFEVKGYLPPSTPTKSNADNSLLP